MIDAFLLSLLQYRGSDLRTAALSGATIPKHTAGQARRRHTVEIKALLYTFKGLQAAILQNCCKTYYALECPCKRPAAPAPGF